MTAISDLTAWKRLGFWFEFKEDRCVWEFRATRHGVARLVSMLDAYAQNPNHSGLSEHEHYGPFGDFKVTTWNVPVIDADGIMGSLSDISRLARLIERRIATMSPGEGTRISKEYSSSSSCAIEIAVVEDEADVFR